MSPGWRRAAFAFPPHPSPPFSRHKRKGKRGPYLPTSRRTPPEGLAGHDPALAGSPRPRSPLPAPRGPAAASPPPRLPPRHGNKGKWENRGRHFEAARRLRHSGLRSPQARTSAARPPRGSSGRRGGALRAQPSPAPPHPATHGVCPSARPSVCLSGRAAGGGGGREEGRGRRPRGGGEGRGRSRASPRGRRRLPPPPAPRPKHPHAHTRTRSSAAASTSRPARRVRFRLPFPLLHFLPPPPRSGAGHAPALPPPASGASLSPTGDSAPLKASQIASVSSANAARLPC